MAALLCAALAGSAAAALPACGEAPALAVGAACFLGKATPFNFSLPNGSDDPLLFALMQNASAPSKWVLEVVVKNSQQVVISSTVAAEGAVLFAEKFSSDYTATVTAPEGGPFAVVSGTAPVLTIDDGFMAQLRVSSPMFFDVPFVVSAAGTPSNFLLNDTAGTNAPKVALRAGNASSTELGEFTTSYAPWVEPGEVQPLKLPNKTGTCKFLDPALKGDAWSCEDHFSCHTEGCCDDHGGLVACPSDTVMCTEAKSDPALNFDCAPNCTFVKATLRPCLLRARLELSIEAEPPAPTGGGGSDGDDDGGLTGGGVFLLIFFIPCGLYCLGGCGYNFFQGRTAWPEVLPHHTFWAELPGMVRDGVFFLQRCVCGSQEERTGQPSGGAGGYAPASSASIGQSAAYGTGPKDEPEGAPGGTTL